MNKIKRKIKEFGMPRIIIILFILVILIGALLEGQNMAALLSDSLVRIGQNMVLALAMLPTLLVGAGLNMGLAIGIVCGLLGGLLSVQWGLTGWLGVGTAMLLALLFGSVVGAGYGKFLNRVKGSEMLIGNYLGSAVVYLMCMFWFAAPFSNPTIIWPMGGVGVRTTVPVSDYYEKVLNQFLAFQIGEVTIPTGLLLFSLLACLLVYLFTNSRHAEGPHLLMSIIGVHGSEILVKNNLSPGRKHRRNDHRNDSDPIHGDSRGCRHLAVMPNGPHILPDLRLHKFLNQITKQDNQQKGRNRDPNQCFCRHHITCRRLPPDQTERRHRSTNHQPNRMLSRDSSASKGGEQKHRRKKASEKQKTGKDIHAGADAEHLPIVQSILDVCQINRIFDSDAARQDDIRFHLDQTADYKEKNKLVNSVRKISHDHTGDHFLAFCFVENLTA